MVMRVISRPVSSEAMQAMSAKSSAPGPVSGREQGARAGALVAGVEDAPGAGGPGHVDGGTVRGRVGGAGDDQHLCGALEGVGQGGGILEVGLADLHAASFEIERLARVADGRRDLGGGEPVQQAFGDGAAELAGGAGNDDHGDLPRD
jgi:hypothetical protein